MTPPTVIRAALTCLLFLGCFAMWVHAILRYRRRMDVIVVESRSEPAWCFADIVIFLSVLLLFEWTGAQLIRLAGLTLNDSLSELPPRGRVLFLLADSCSKLLTVVISLAIVHLRSGYSLAELGITTHRLTYDLRLGGRLFLLVAPLALLVQLVTTIFHESSHPLVDVLQQKPDAAFVAMGTFSAVIAAPIAEEYAFRGLLQGLLERFGVGKFEGSDPILGVSLETPPPAAAAPAQESSTTEPQRHFQPPLWPIGVSSVLFALVHYNHGPDWIALIVFALGLGYATRCTGRLLPAITAHMLLNGWSIAMLGLSLLSE